MTFVFAESNDCAIGAGFREGKLTWIFTTCGYEGLRFQDGDKIYLLGAVRPEVEYYVRQSIVKSGAKVAVVRQR